MLEKLRVAAWGPAAAITFQKEGIKGNANEEEEERSSPLISSNGLVNAHYRRSCGRTGGCGIRRRDGGAGTQFRLRRPCISGPSGLSLQNPLETESPFSLVISIKCFF